MHFDNTPDARNIVDANDESKAVHGVASILARGVLRSQRTSMITGTEEGEKSLSNLPVNGLIDVEDRASMDLETRAVDTAPDQGTGGDS